MKRSSNLAYNMYEAKTKLSEIVEKVCAGEEIILMLRGEPVAKVVPLRKKNRSRLGFAKDIKILPGFQEIPEGFEAYT
ncbi:MAG: type II toxin-antitoxin system prevent-host-death family antitoxin [Deltaproteobacteria bacterium]|nr:type II toxin-antitoxin system prevent-host-death family antitoxin [Deltaproteobacteria bacterium]